MGTNIFLYLQYSLLQKQQTCVSQKLVFSCVYLTCSTICIQQNDSIIKNNYKEYNIYRTKIYSTKITVQKFTARLPLFIFHSSFLQENIVVLFLSIFKFLSTVL